MFAFVKSLLIFIVFYVVRLGVGIRNVINMIWSVSLEVLKVGRLIKTYTRLTDWCTHAVLADLMQCSAWGSPAVCSWLAGCQWVRWEGLGRDSPRMCLPDALLPQVSTAAVSVKLQQSSWIQDKTWQDRLDRPRLTFRHPLCVQALCPGELTPGQCFAVCGVHVWAF